MSCFNRVTSSQSCSVICIRKRKECKCTHFEANERKLESAGKFAALHSTGVNELCAVAVGFYCDVAPCIHNLGL